MRMFSLRPRSDTCQVCDSLSTHTAAESDPGKKAQLQSEWDLHKTKTQHAYHQLAEDTIYAKSNHDVVLLSFDLQQTLPTPQLTTNIVFYKRQLWTYNLGIHNRGTGECSAYMWYEGTAARGSTEIGSCLLRREVNVHFSLSLDSL